MNSLFIQIQLTGPLNEVPGSPGHPTSPGS